MPGGDRTGPEGRGPMTGRRLGYCTGGTPPGYGAGGYGWGRGGGRGFGRGRGMGYGRGFWRIFPENDPIPRVERQTSEDEKAELKALRDRVRSLEEELQRTKDRLKEGEK
ncbi:hypothetical protein B6U90_05435 [Thermoplasmatales archaeon ex4484_6]|nr:MAG: hypothetical protein B6U90_05435 [Thermoplasmatales archaeon ex4484_6]RLF66182.1 MAG: hypothetical protein DRN57_07630 [Thermoplasmata archaeon]